MEWHAPIGVSDHACIRAQERLRWPGIGTGEEIVEKIRADVREQILFGRLTAERPTWLYSPRTVEERSTGTRYAYDGAATRCWVLEPAHDRRRIVVVTLISAQYFDAAHGEPHRLRRGMVRR